MNALINGPRQSFSVGICATGDVPQLGELMQSILTEADSSGFMLKRLIVVASGCPSFILALARDRQALDSRIRLIVEEVRHGKADAVNKIINETEGDFLVFVNSDATPEKGAVSRLLSTAAADERVGALSGMPVTDGGSGLASLIMDLMWSAHNECSVVLNHMNLSNHSSDELVLFRPSAIDALPEDLVNDGAYLAMAARRKGYTVKVCPSAGVRIQTPRRISDLVGQRRRIIYGHRQVWQKTGSPPKTIESMLFSSPTVGLRILVATLSKKPRLVLALPIAVVTELTSAILSLVDAAGSSKKHVVWRRFT